ncbi:unnamed protein product [Mytilus edulis]|uniref:Uncharacterized protein n=1 Tax=Mytilus edulis TaxID=6550 RepID=A0A8S3TWL3_MYTED|nr:unnamed protein product [Mytilus edulis]
MRPHIHIIVFVSDKQNTSGDKLLETETDQKEDILSNLGGLRCNTSPMDVCYDSNKKSVALTLHKGIDVDQCRDDVNVYEINGYFPLCNASQNGQRNTVKFLLENNHNINQCNNDRSSPLFLAKNNSNVDLSCNDGCRPLIRASMVGHTDIVELLLKSNSDVDLPDNSGYSPLCMASQEGHTQIVKLLLERNPNVDLCDEEGFTPLIIACIYNHISIVQLLLKHKPNINAQTDDGGSALYFSAQNGNVDITKLLLENNDDCYMCIYSKQSITDRITNHPSKILDEEKKTFFENLLTNTLSTAKDYVSKKSVDYAFDVVASSSPLHIACFIGKRDVVCCLLDHNAKINMAKKMEQHHYSMHVKWVTRILYVYYKGDIIKPIDTDSLILGICYKQLKLKLDTRDIGRFHPIGEIKDGKISIIVRFLSYRQRQLVFSNKRKLKGNTNKTFIAENLTKHRYNLLHRLNTLREKGKINSFWTHDGSILIKQSENSRPKVVISRQDIYKLGGEVLEGDDQKED